MASQLTMPRLSQDMETGTLVEWLKHEGDSVPRGDAIVVVETDKANVDVEAPESGVLLRIVAQEGTDQPIGALLGLIGEAGELEPAFPAAEGEGLEVADVARESLAEPAKDGRPVGGDVEARRTRQPASPAARRVAAELGVDLASVVGTGPAGLVSEADVRAFAERVVEGAGDEAEAGAWDAVPLTGMRSRIADQMALSRRTAADVTTVIDVSMDAVARLRAGSGLSYTTYVAWAVARTLPEYPDLNATFVENTIRRHRTVNLGVAVAVDAGLVVPVVRAAERLTPKAIEDEVGRLASLAKQGRIPPGDLTGRSFTITNSGVFGSLLFTPIINIPEVAILGVGRVADAAVVRQGQVVPGKVAYLCLSYDHRGVDGADAVRFLAAVKRRLEDVESEAAQ